VAETLSEDAGTNDADGLAAAELTALFRDDRFAGLLSAHDRVARRREAAEALAGGVRDGGAAEEALLDRLSRYSEPNIRVVRIEKTSDPLGATVKNEGDAVVVGRIIRGGTAEATGLLREGDEILEVNEVALRGKHVNEVRRMRELSLQTSFLIWPPFSRQVCDILARMTGTLTLLVVPARSLPPSAAGEHKSIMHVKAHIDYDPEDDPYMPCRELGLSFFKGDVLHVINQK